MNATAEEPKKKSLQDMAAELNGIFHKLEENGGEMTEEILERLKSLEMDIPAKIDGIAYRIREMKARIEFIKAEETRIKQRKDSINREIEALRGYAFFCVKSIGGKLKTPLTTASIRTNAPKLEIVNQDLIPQRYKIVNIINVPALKLEFIPDEIWDNSDAMADIKTLDAKIKEDLVNGVEIPGARLGEPTESLQLR